MRRIQLTSPPVGGLFAFVGCFLWSYHHFEGPASEAEYQTESLEAEHVAPQVAGKAQVASKMAETLETGPSGKSASSEDVSDTVALEGGTVYRSQMEPLAQDFIHSNQFVGPNASSQLPSLSQPFVDSDSIVGVNAVSSEPALVATFVPSGQFVGPDAVMYRSIRGADAESSLGQRFTDRPDSTYPSPKREDFHDVMSLPTAD